MHSHKKRYALSLVSTLLLMMALILSSCGGDASTPAQTGKDKAPDDQQIYHNALAGIQDIKTFDPALATTQTSLDPINMVFNGLVALDNDLKVQPELAESWEASTDGLTYTFKLKPDLKFSNGTDPLTSEDAAYSIDRALDKDLNSPASPSYLNLIKDYEKRLDGSVKSLIGTSLTTPDKQTLVIKLNKPAGYFLATMTYSTSYVVNKKIVEKYGKDWTDHIGEGAGAGIFNVKEYIHGQHIYYTPNANYPYDKPQLKEVQTVFVKDAETAYQNYQNGQLDVTAVPSVHLDEAAANTAEYKKVPVLSIFYYGMNFLAKPFNNINIRKAFALALNKDVIVKTAWKNVDVPTNHIVPKGMPGYFEGLKGVDGTTNTSGNPDKAKELFAQGLKEEGYANAAALPKITLKYPSGSEDGDNETAIAIQQWKDVLGVTVQSAPTDFEVLSDATTKTPGNDSLQLWKAGWGADYPDAQDFLTLLFGKGNTNPNNGVNFGNNKVDNKSATIKDQIAAQDKMEKADVEQDPAKRLALYNEAEQTLVDNAAWIPLYQLARSRLLKPYVIGRVFNAQDFIPARAWSKIYIAAH